MAKQDPYRGEVKKQLVIELTSRQEMMLQKYAHLEGFSSVQEWVLSLTPSPPVKAKPKWRPSDAAVESAKIALVGIAVVAFVFGWAVLGVFIGPLASLAPIAIFALVCAWIVLVGWWRGRNA